jgi:hypothetical protein
MGVLAFVGNAAVRPAIAEAATDDDAAAPSRANAPAPSVEPTVTPSAANGAVPAPPYPAPPYPPTPYGQYPPPGYAPPGYAPYPGYPPPPMQLTMVHRARVGLLIAGALTFGASWGLAATISLVCAGRCSDGADYLWVPIAGPLLLDVDASDASGILILWSAAQAAGAIMFIVGAIGRDVMEYRIARHGPTVQLAPLFARDASGMALTARW